MNSAIGFAAYGRQCLRAGNVDAAVAAFEEARALEPQNARVLADLGVAWAHKKEFKRALETLRASLQVKPDQLDVLCVIAELSLDELDFPAAAHALQKCLDLDPQAKHPSGLRARALVKKGLKKLKTVSA